MENDELNSLRERLEQGAARIVRERFPWIPRTAWKSRDTACVVSPRSGETIELELINDTPRAMFICHSCFVASKAEVDFMRRSMLLYSVTATPSLPVKGLIFALSIGAF